SHGRLSLEGYCIDVSEQGWAPKLTVQTPQGELYAGREPGRWLTRKGATLMLVGPLVAAGLAMALGSRSWGEWPCAVWIPLWFAAIVYVGLRFFWRARPDPGERAVDWSWVGLAPRLHTDDFSLDDGAFAAALALTSTHRGRSSVRSEILARLVQKTER